MAMLSKFKFFEDWNAQYAEKGLKRAEYFLTMIQRYSNIKGKMVLDLGCGNGYLSMEVAKIVSIVVALDIKSRILKDFRASRLFKEKIIELIADATYLPFRSGTFNIVLSYDLYEHVNNQDQLLDEIFRVVRQNGYVALSTGNKLFPKDRHTGLWFIDYFPQKLANAYLRKFKKRVQLYEVHQPNFWSLKSKLLKYTRDFFIDGNSVLKMFRQVYPEMYRKFGASLTAILNLAIYLKFFKFITPKYFVFAYKNKKMGIEDLEKEEK